MQNQSSGTASYLPPICMKRLHLCSHSLLWPPNGHLANCWPLCRPVWCTHSWPVGDWHWVAPQSHTTHLHLQVSSHYQKGFRYWPAWAAAHRPSPAREDLQEGTGISPGHPGQRHVAHHTVQGGLQVYLCWTSPESHLKGCWSFFWHLAHALTGFLPTAPYLRPQEKVSCRTDPLDRELQGLPQLLHFFQICRKVG